MQSTSDDCIMHMRDNFTLVNYGDDDEGLIMEDVSEGGDSFQDVFKWCLVGYFLTDKPINFAAMRTTLASLWQPVKGVCIKELYPNRSIFQFFHLVDMNRVL